MLVVDERTYIVRHIKRCTGSSSAADNIRSGLCSAQTTQIDVLTSHTMYGKTDFACVRSVLVGQDHGDD